LLHFLDHQGCWFYKRKAGRIDIRDPLMNGD